MSRKIVYEGETALGYRRILEGDIVEFVKGFKGRAFFSSRYTPKNQLHHEISFKFKDYDYGFDYENCHSFYALKLTCHISPEPKERKRTGFGKFIRALEAGNGI